MTVRALVVPVDGPGEVRELEPDLRTLQGVVGGWLEGVQANITEGDWHAYCDEEGKLKQLPVNRLATKIAFLGGWRFDDVLCGPVIFLGNGAEGEEDHVPDPILSLWRQLTSH